MRKVLLVAVILFLPSIAPLIQTGYFPMHDDLQAMRQLQLDKCFSDFQLPCRWVPDMGYSYGYPLFNFYPPLPYYIGQGVHWLGFSFTETVKVLGILVFAASAVTMFLLAAEFFGSLGGVLAAMVYLYAPYHSVDFYVRAAVNESWAMVWFPLIYWLTYRLVKNPSWKLVPWVALSVTALMLSHNPMLMIFAPTYMIWIFFWWIKFKSISSFKYLLVSALWALGLAAFFTIPVLIEQKYAHLETLVIGYFNFLAHFLNFKQMFLKINWGYGSSILGPEDTMSFAIGYLQWIIPFTLAGLVLFSKKLAQHKSMLILILFLFASSVFLTHSKATWLWQHFQPLEFLQFPWRFLTLVIFFASFVSGALVLISKKFLPIVLMLLLLLNANYFRPRDWWPQANDQDRFSGENWRLQLTSGIFDYLPIWGKLPPAGAPNGDIEFFHGSGTYERLQKTSNKQKYTVFANADSTIIIQTFYFPGWKIWLDGKQVNPEPLRDPEKIGRIIVDVPAGIHEVSLKFVDTPVRLIANTISVISLLSLIIVYGRRKFSRS